MHRTARANALAAWTTTWLASVAAGQGLLIEPVAEVPLRFPLVIEAETAGESVPAKDQLEPTKHWGDAGTVTINGFASYADDFDGTEQVPLAVGISWFPIRDFSIDLQAEGSYISQPGPDAGGAGLAVVVRWHFLTNSARTWSLYADLGIGFLALTESVPAGEGDFVFTPRAGIGMSFRITDDARLLAGARWYHISNAQTASDNEGINALQVYAGVSVKF